MCILCVASRWSRRIVTMLPWLIIPLIILWALSQLLPPGFRFEVTSPRLACVGVLLISLGWYELAMPRLSQWRARRSAMLRERRRIEAQEAAKWRKEATRRCRNCLSAYRDQSPGGGRFMCTYCGHVSKRPVLDVPGGGTGGGMQAAAAAGGGGLGGQGVPMNPSAAGGALFPRNGKGWNARGWPERAGGSWAGPRGWGNGGKQWASGDGGAWGVGNGAWVGTSWSGAAWVGNAGHWAGGFGSYGTGFSASDKCGSTDPNYGGMLCAFLRVFPLLACVRVFSMLLLFLRWAWARLTGDSSGDDGTMNGNRRGGPRRGEDAGPLERNRGDKARRKAEEKKQARLEREQLEEEERRQREEVARLVEERRKLRDEKLEAERESEREAAAEREREMRREREAERRRQDKLREKEREAAAKAKDTDSEDSCRRRKDSRRDADRRVEGERRGDVDRKVESKAPGATAEYRKGTKGFKGVVPDAGLKGDGGYKAAGASSGKSLNVRYQGAVKGPLPASKNGISNQSNSSYFWRNPAKYSKGPVNAASSTSPPAVANGSSSGKKADSSSYSAWKVWPKGWGKGQLPASEGGNVTPPASVVKSKDTSSQNGGLVFPGGTTGAQTPDFLQSVVGEPTQQSATQSRPWQRLFSNSTDVVEQRKEDTFSEDCWQKQDVQTESGGPYLSMALPLNPILTSSGNVDSQGGSPTCLTSLSMGSVIHVPASSPVLAPISAPLSAAASSALSSIPIYAATSVLSPVIGCSAVPLGSTSIVTPVHAPVSAPMQVPVVLPLPMTSQGPDHVPQDQLPQILEPWATPKLSVDSLDLATEKKWQMWEAPQLDQIQLPLVDTWIPFEDGDLDQLKDSSTPASQGQLIEPEIQWPSGLFPPIQQHGSPGQGTGDQLSMVSEAASNSIWSDSAYASAVNAWGDADVLDSQSRMPAEFVDCITQEVMIDPVITADGHSYERSAIEQWLKYHDTSPRTGEVLPPPPGGNGSGVDKTLRPNHILRGQIIDYKERLQRSGVHDARDSGCRWTSPWSFTGLIERPYMGSLYSPQLWSFNPARVSLINSPPL